MVYLVVKALMSGLLIAAASELARRSPGMGGLVASLPLVSILAMIWLWRDTANIERVASLSQSTFWFVIPSLPMFLVVPALLRSDFGFWPSLSSSCLLTLGLYALAFWLLPRMGVQL